MHSISPHQNHHHMPSMGSFGLALQQMRSNAGNTMGGYPLNNPMSNNSNESMPNMKNVLMPSLHSPMDSQASIMNEMTPKKRGRKKKTLTDDRSVRIPLYFFHFSVLLSRCRSDHLMVNGSFQCKMTILMFFFCFLWLF